MQKVEVCDFAGGGESEAVTEQTDQVAIAAGPGKVRGTITFAPKVLASRAVLPSQDQKSKGPIGTTSTSEDEVVSEDVNLETPYIIMGKEIVLKLLDIEEYNSIVKGAPPPAA